MKEYWEITHDRGVATLAVWFMNQGFALKNCTFADHTTRVEQMPGKAADRDAAEADHTDARQVTADFFAELNNLIVRVPGVIDGQLSPDSELHGQLDLVYAVGLNVSQATSLRRGRLVAGLWLDFNAALAEESPVLPPLIMKYQKADSDDAEVNVTQENFNTLIGNCLAAQNNEANALRPVSNAKSALRAQDRRVDRDNKRWYRAWTKFYPEGTPEGDAARAQVPTEEGTPLPNALEIASIVVHADRTVTMNYPATGGAARPKPPCACLVDRVAN